MRADERAYLAGHRAHDVAELLRRWRLAITDAGWQSVDLAAPGELPVLAIETGVGGGPGLYISAGIHGDEPAAPWGLLEWFERDGYRLADRRFVIFPCLNPGGLALNTRANNAGQDLNRQFHNPAHPLVAAWRKFLGGRSFELAVCLHEDYDGRGVYVYELHRGSRSSLAARLLDNVEKIIPRDPRPAIDGRRAKQGVIRRSKIPPHLPGYPEAIALHLDHATLNLTFETPSEFSFFARVRAHRAFIHAVTSEVFG
jgi:protein MpaA